VLDVFETMLAQSSFEFDHDHPSPGWNIDATWWSDDYQPAMTNPTSGRHRRPAYQPN